MPGNASDRLKRFLEAQAGFYENALAELKAGEKETHWIWFVFPQVKRLGSSAFAQHYAIRSRSEALAYLKHPVLGKRLRECAEALLQVNDRSAEEIMGFPDCLKLKSSMTLFAALAEPESPFKALLEKYFAGEKDSQTLLFLSEYSE